MNIYITWHYTTHGIAYLKHVLSAFYSGEARLTDNPIRIHGLNQVKLNDTFSESLSKGVTFDKVFYLTAPQASFDKIASRRKVYRRSILEDQEIIRRGMLEVWEEVLSQDVHEIESELKLVKRKFPEKFELFQELLWRDIQHYPIEEQIKWFNKWSNASRKYSEKFTLVNFEGITDLRDELQITGQLQKWVQSISSQYPDAQFVINVSLGSNETQVAWHCLGEAGLLPKNTRFIKTYDDKSDNSDTRFKRFSIIEIKTNLISDIGTSIKLYENTASELRKLSDLKMKVFLATGFSILLIGERGTGKSNLATKHKGPKVKFVAASCASFSDDSTAESELFGYDKGAFTGALREGKMGLFQEANKGILFLDEIHHLSTMVQAKLMKALQTDSKNVFTIRRFGSTTETKVECRVIFATNKSVDELKEILLPDFYDRIVQHVINIPPLRDTPEDRQKDWQAIWLGLKFKNVAVSLNDKVLMNWLDTLPLHGNFRDLQKIAMYYYVFEIFDEETKRLSGYSNAFSYAKSEFEKYHSRYNKTETGYVFSESSTTEDMSKDFFSQLSIWSIRKYKSASKAVKHFKELGEDISEKTLYNWKNKV